MSRVVPNSKIEMINATMDFAVKVAEIVSRDDRYSPEGYGFIMEVLHSVINKLRERRHLSSREFLDGIRKYGIKQFGPMTKSVLNHWGINTTDDFGEIIFNLVGSGIIKKNELDSRNDFRGVFDFEVAFVEPYRRSHRPRIEKIMNYELRMMKKEKKQKKERDL